MAPMAPFNPGDPCGRKGKGYRATQQVTCIRPGLGQLRWASQFLCPLCLLPGHAKALQA